MKSNLFYINFFQMRIGIVTSKISVGLEFRYNSAIVVLDISISFIKQKKNPSTSHRLSERVVSR